MAKCSISITVSVFFFAFALVVANFGTPANGLGGTVVGGRTKVPDVKTNKEIQDLGRYSVKEYNRLQRRRQGSNGGGDLKFSEVIAAEKQVVSGTKYYLKVAAFEASSGVPKTFDAELVVKPWAHSKQLLNFAPSPSTK